MKQYPFLFSGRKVFYSCILKLLQDFNKYCILYIRKIEMNIVALMPVTPENKRFHPSIRSFRIKDETYSFAKEYIKERMQIKSHSNSFLAITLLTALCCSFLLLTPKISQAGWEQVMNAASDLSQGAQKKRTEINKRVAMDDKKVKEALDKVFKDQFEKVFEGDLKPSQVYDVFQFVEAASAGDLDAAMKTGGEFMVGLIPGVGQYISAMKSLAKGIRMAEQVWINELYQTNAYNNLFSIVNPALREDFNSDSFRPPEPFSRSYGGAPYIPSFLIRYAPDAPEAAIMGRLQAHMQRWEASMYEQWRAVDGGWPVTQLQQPPWAAKLRSAYGKVLSDREIFNRFLYRIVEPDRNKILENLRWIYLRPAAMKAALQEKQKINAAVEQALAKISFDDRKESLPVLKPVRDVGKDDPRRQQEKTVAIDPPSSSGPAIIPPSPAPNQVEKPWTKTPDKSTAPAKKSTAPEPLWGSMNMTPKKGSRLDRILTQKESDGRLHLPTSPVKRDRYSSTGWVHDHEAVPVTLYGQTFYVNPATETLLSSIMSQPDDIERIQFQSPMGKASHGFVIEYDSNRSTNAELILRHGVPGRMDDPMQYTEEALELYKGKFVPDFVSAGGIRYGSPTPAGSAKTAKAGEAGEARWVKIVDEVLADAVHPAFSAKFPQNVQKTRQNMLASKSVDHQKLGGMTPSQLAAYTRETKVRFAKTIYDQFMAHPFDPLGETSVRHLLAKGLVSQTQMDAYLKKNAKKESKKEIYTRLIALRDRMDPEIRKLTGDISGYNYSIKNLNTDLKQAAPGLRQLRDRLQSQPVKQRSASDVSRYNSGRMAYNQKLTQKNKLADQIKKLKAKRNSMIDLLKSIDTAWKTGDHRQALDIANNSPVAREYGWETFNP